MSRTPARFTQADIARALRAVDQTGGGKEVVIEPDGRIRIVPGQSKAQADSAKQNKQVCQVDLCEDIRL